jgi:hypothetical protein
VLTFDSTVALTLTCLQKNKHFQCGTCHKKLNTATALKTHCLYVHKEEITRVPNARPGRDEFGFDVVGMDGIPGEKHARAHV